MDDDSPTTTKNKTSLPNNKKTSRNPAKPTALRKTSKKARPAKNSFVDSFKNEWSLFWEGLTGTESEIRNHQDDEFGLQKVQPMTMKQIKDITKSLSQEKMRLNQRLESLHREIELNSTKLQSLQIVGGDSDDTVRRLAELNDEGQRLSHELAELDNRLRRVRRFEFREKSVSV